MSRKTAVWCWRLWIDSRRQEHWIARLDVAGISTWTLTERSGRIRHLLAVYFAEKNGAIALQKQLGGQVRQVLEREWIKPSPATRIGRWIEITHEKQRGGDRSDIPRLHIPLGIAFGSGDHATTGMLLRELAHEKDWSGASVLDLGTGSGILALAARRFGAKKIVATDFDADAVRTARQNEAHNFRKPLIRWRCADVKKLRPTARYNLILANLFSGILAEAAPQIVDSLAPGGRLWLSGVLRSQQQEVIGAYLWQGLRLVQVTSCGKWVMIRFINTDEMER